MPSGPIGALRSAWVHTRSFVADRLGPERGLNLSVLESEALTAQVIQIRDLDTGEILGEKNADQAVIPASTAKLFTIDFALRWLDEEDTVQVGDELELVARDASSAYLVPGLYSVGDLVTATLVPSGTDASYALMAAVGRAIANDPAMPGREAIDTGMTFLATYLRDEGYADTHLVDPGGYSTDNRTSVEDMYLLVTRLLRNETIETTVSKERVTIRNAAGQEFTYENSNPFLSTQSGLFSSRARGVKTGSLDDYYNLVLRMDYPDRKVLLLLYGAPTEEERNEQARQLVESRTESPRVGFQSVFLRRIGSR